jgi:shikimate dehydrogenase
MGYPIKRSLSRYMHDAAFEHLGIDATYLPFEVEPGQVEIAIQDWLATGVQGGNVTIPHKETVASVLTRLEGDAAKLKTVNTLVREGDEYVGYTTDGDGFVNSLKEQGIEVNGKEVALLGAGGAAKSIASALLRNDVKELVVINRTTARAQELIDELDSGKTGAMEDVSDADLIVNATSLGMGADYLPPELNQVVENLSEHQIVADIVYVPRDTALLRAARERGAKTIDGLGMLLHQAALAFELWTKQPPPLEVMRNALLIAAEK